MTLFVSPWLRGASHSLGRLSPEREGWIIILFRGEYLACGSTVAVCPCASQPRPLLSARLSYKNASEWVYILMPALLLILQACDYRIYKKMGFLNFTPQVTWRRAHCSLYFQAVGRQRWESYGCLGCFTPAGTGCHQVCKTHMYLQRKPASEV